MPAGATALGPQRRRATILGHGRRTAAGDSLRRRHATLIQELRLAAEVQRSLLPRVLPRLPTLEFGASLRPCLHLAGDFYNVVRLDRDHVGIYLGDVMGHGPASALLGVFAMQALRLKTIEGSNYEILPPSEVLATLSHDLIQAAFPEGPFVTMFYGILNTSNHVLTYCCGGHPPALLLRAGRSPQRLEGRSPLLGVFDAPFEQDQFALAAGDRVALYSDGVEGVTWGDFGRGIEGLADLLSVRDGYSPQERIDRAMSLATPRDGLEDDLTIVLTEISSSAPRS